MCSLRCDGICEWNKQWHEGRPVGKSFSWERRAGDVTSERVFQKANRGDGPSCPSAAAAFCWRFSSVIPIQFYGLREFIIQLHLCLLADIERVKPISSRKSKRIHFNYTVTLLHWHCISKNSAVLSFLCQATITHLFQGITCNCLECLFYVYGFFGTGLKVGDVVLTLTPSLSPFRGYLWIWGRISLSKITSIV